MEVFDGEDMIECKLCKGKGEVDEYKHDYFLKDLRGEEYYSE